MIALDPEKTLKSPVEKSTTGSKFTHMRPPIHYRPRYRLLFPAALFAAIAVTAGLMSGSGGLLYFGADSAGSVSMDIVTKLRLPRVATAFACGALLSLAGVIMQVLLRNPLADPYVLGVSGGAATGAILAMMAGVTGYGVYGGAWSGALLSTFLIFFLIRTDDAWSPARLLLTGVVLASGWGAAITLLISLSPADDLRGILFWLIGDLSIAHHGLQLWGVLAGGILLSLGLSRKLNVLSRGETVAAALGESVVILRGLLFLLASVLTAAAVTAIGAVGFVGLVIPHAMRLLVGSDHRIVLPAVCLAGGGFLVLADTLARTVAAPLQLPTGAITALIGVPVFLFLLHRNSRIYRQLSQ